MRGWQELHGCLGVVKWTSAPPGQDVKVLVLEGPAAESSDLKKREFKIKQKQVMPVAVSPEIAAAVDGVLSAINATKKPTEAIIEAQYTILQPGIAVKEEPGAEPVAKKPKTDNQMATLMDCFARNEDKDA